MIQIAQFGKDHWSLLAYIQTLCLDANTGIGRINANRMRTNRNTHPYKGNDCLTKWDNNWGTRLFGAFESKNPVADGLKLETHDDWDCLEDLEKNGLVEIISDVNNFVVLTPEGKKVSLLLSEHKLNGGQYAHFQLHEHTA